MKMKTKLSFGLILGGLLLASCGVVPVSTSSSSSANPSSSSSQSTTSASAPSSSKTTSSATSSSTASTSSSSSSSTGSSTSTSTSSYVPADGVFNFYAINDFHGSILENSSGTYYEGGLAKVGGKLKEFKAADPDHTFIISSGDMWQGSMESNLNEGALITEAMNNIGFDSMTLGNHEFDYGQASIFANQAKANFPFLAGNIRTWENGQVTATSWGKTNASTTILRGGVKVGIVGMIGQGQTTSITSKNVQDVSFIDPLGPAEKEATKLRNEGCTIVILSIHDDVSTPEGWEYSGLKSYFDGAFCAHSHRQEVDNQNGVPFLQGACNGEGISHFTLSVASGVVTCTNYEFIAASASWSEDSELLAIENKYIGTTAFKEKANASCGTLSGSLTYSTVANAGCKAIYENYKTQYPNLACAMENKQRASVPSGSMTYSTLYKATPFTNNIVIVKVLGEDIANEAKYNKTYTGDTATYGTLDSSTYYTIAIIDYLVYHQSINKSYDYFPSFSTTNILGEYKTYPVDLTFNYFSSLSGTILATSFSDNATGFNLYA